MYVCMYVRKYECTYVFRCVCIVVHVCSKGYTAYLYSSMSAIPMQMCNPAVKLLSYSKANNIWTTSAVVEASDLNLRKMVQHSLL